jgi:Exostosin family
MLDLMDDPLFYCTQYCTYPPFKCGYYLEEFFLDYMQRHDLSQDRHDRTYIPALWTAMQIEGWFPQEKSRLQSSLNKYIEEHPNPNGYFTVVQHDDGVLFDLPVNTIVYGACSSLSQHIIPLIYQDTRNTLELKTRKPYQEKTILCSFVGTTTHPIRSKCYDKLHQHPGFEFHMNPTWTNAVGQGSQDLFIDKTLSSKFALAPRGYGRSSFRFYEIFKLGTIPIYVWDDVEWLPYKEHLDYQKFCISIHESQIEELPAILEKIDETKYQEMQREYEKIKSMFDLDYMAEYITKKA